MGQVAFDTQEFVETLENAGLPKDQARAISIAVRKSHEVADVATRRDLEDTRKDLTAQIAEVKRDVAEVRKDLAFDIADARKEAAADMALLRKDVESLTNKMIIKMASIMVGAIGVATAIIKLL
ncbi:coiled-coil domain-containing protein [Sodalis sp. (in: enterobacteria)]|uniref:coiled-coil domain-containing protein n=1 Tax=Sodalis sp. (in: enterobacteria) TaxID=1898979 RepID=UPI003F354E23